MKSDAATVEGYLSELSEERREAVSTLDRKRSRTRGPAREVLVPPRSR